MAMKRYFQGALLMRCGRFQSPVPLLRPYRIAVPKSAWQRFSLSSYSVVWLDFENGLSSYARQSVGKSATNSGGRGFRRAALGGERAITRRLGRSLALPLVRPRAALLAILRQQCWICV